MFSHLIGKRAKTWPPVPRRASSFMYFKKTRKSYHHSQVELCPPQHVCTKMCIVRKNIHPLLFAQLLHFPHQISITQNFFHCYPNTHPIFRRFSMIQCLIFSNLFDAMGHICLFHSRCRLRNIGKSGISTKNTTHPQHTCLKIFS
jgi:hypothetical protein